MSFLLDAKAQVPGDVGEVVDSNLAHSPGELEVSWSAQIDEHRKGGETCMRVTDTCGDALPDARRRVRGRANLPLIARTSGKLDTGGQMWVWPFTHGYPATENIGEPGVCLAAKSRRQPGLAPDQVFENAKGRIKERRSGPRDPSAT